MCMLRSRDLIVMGKVWLVAAINVCALCHVLVVEFLTWIGNLEK